MANKKDFKVSNNHNELKKLSASCLSEFVRGLKAYGLILQYNEDVWDFFERSLSNENKEFLISRKEEIKRLINEELDLPYRLH